MSEAKNITTFTDFEATFMKKTISPYANIRLGYCLGLPDDEILPKNGIYSSPTIGFR